MFGAAVAVVAEDVAFTDVERRRILQHAAVPVPADPTNRYADDPGAAHLGRWLFFETRFNPDNAISCATCHVPARAFADGRTTARGLADLPRHAPALWNVGHQRWFLWDGRRDTLWAQALQPLEDPREHGSSRGRVVRLLHDDPELRAAYEHVFGPMPDLSDLARFPADARPVPDDPDDPTGRAWSAMTDVDRRVVDGVFANVGKALAAYQRQIISADAPFDVFAEGLRTDDPAKRAALSPQEQRGLKLFVGAANCRLCHAGPNFSDGEFHNTGVPPAGGGAPSDQGRYAGIALVQADPFNAAGVHSDQRDGPTARQVTSLLRSPETWGQFKTPSLRHVATTAPYMHGGQMASLAEVLRFYSTREGAVQFGHHEDPLLVPLGLTDEELGDLEAFLKTLTGAPLPPELLGPPASPRPPATATPRAAERQETVDEFGENGLD